MRGVEVHDQLLLQAAVGDGVSGQGVIRAELRAAIIDACQVRGDSREHARACMTDALAEAAEDWPWWRDYFRGEAARWRSIKGMGNALEP